MIFFEEKDLQEIFKINPDAKVEDVIYDNVKFKVIKNFLLHPKKYIKILQNFPATTDHTYSPGYRQEIPSWAARFITSHIQKNIVEEKENIVDCNQEEIDDLIRIYTDHEEGC